MRSSSAGRIDRTLSSRTLVIFILRFTVLGWIATTPWVALTAALMTTLSTVMLTFFKVLVTAAWMLAKLFIEEIEILPEDEVIGALELLNELDPEMVTSSVAEIVALGFTVVPPLIVRLPAEVNVPVPPYAPDGVSDIFPEAVVVWLPLTVTSPPNTAMSPAML